jgi:hypothetical protein
MNTWNLAQGLAWFGMGLGAAEILAGDRFAKMLGVPHTVLTLFGLREIGSGVAILASTQKTRGVWSRIAGDAIDLAVLGTVLRQARNKRTATAIAAGSVLGIGAFDLACGAQLLA